MSGYVANDIYFISEFLNKWIIWKTESYLFLQGTRSYPLLPTPNPIVFYTKVRKKKMESSGFSLVLSLTML